MTEQRPRTAGLFDLRWIIALLMGIFGLVVTLVGLFSEESTQSASGKDLGANVNLWSGIPMLLLAIGFGIWAQLRPTVIEEAVDQPARTDEPEP